MQKERCCEKEKFDGNEKLLLYIAMLFLAISTGTGIVIYYCVGGWSIFSIFFAVAAIFSWGFYKNQKVALRVCIVLALTAAVIGGILIVYLAGVYPVKDSSDVAAWVQAVGSLLALLGVYWATNKQANSALNVLHEEQKIKEKAQIEVVKTRIKIANDWVQSIFQKVMKEKEDPNQSSVVSALSISVLLNTEASIQYIELHLRSLKEAPTDQIKSDVLLNQILDFNLQLEVALKYMKMYDAGPRKHPAFQDIVNGIPFRNESEVADMLYESMRDNLIKVLEELQNRALKLLK